jgi:hypothetical protein
MTNYAPTTPSARLGSNLPSFSASSQPARPHLSLHSSSGRSFSLKTCQAFNSQSSPRLPVDRGTLSMQPFHGLAKRFVGRKSALKDTKVALDYSR